MIAALASLAVSASVKSTFRKYSSVASRSGMTGAAAAQRVLSANGVSGVRIAPCSGQLTDHYDPRDRTIYLSEPVYAASTPAAIGVAAHEAGHAVQHAAAYLPLQIRNAIVPVTNIGSRLAMPLILIGIIFSYETLALIGVALFGLCVVFQVVTLPTEFNASHRAVECLAVSLSEDELQGAKKTLRAAAMTYVAALAVSVLQFLRLLAIATSWSRRRR